MRLPRIAVYCARADRRVNRAVEGLERGGCLEPFLFRRFKLTGSVAGVWNRSCFGRFTYEVEILKAKFGHSGSDSAVLVVACRLQLATTLGRASRTKLWAAPGMRTRWASTHERTSATSAPRNHWRAP